MTQETVAVIGARGRIGSALCVALKLRGHLVIKVNRGDPMEMIEMATLVANCASAIMMPWVYLHAKNARRIVTVGSARFVTEAERYGPERRMIDSLMPRAHSVVLFPTMIYGGDEKNVSVMRDLANRIPWVPVVDQGRRKIHPVHFMDVVACVEAALFRDDAVGKAIVVAGERPIPMWEFYRAIKPGVRLVNVPHWLYRLGARCARWFLRWPITDAQIERMFHDRAYDTMPMIKYLGVSPRRFQP